MTGTIAVVGGAYFEECSFPRSTVSRGSGVRAAIVLAGLGNVTTLHTACGDHLSTDVRALAAQLPFAVHIAPRTQDIWFRYRHPLASPDMFPSVGRTAIAQSAITATDALVFGMIEGRPTVNADHVVYDPQDGIRATAFDSNGSIAKQLSIVASLSEARALTGKSDPDEAAAALLESNSCSAVIVKCGPQGALVATHSARDWISSFPSSRVWKIGSGDVFSAAYAHAWINEANTPLEAAWFASRMVSEYVATRKESFSPADMLVIRSDAAKAAAKARQVARPIPGGSIYLAGPFFTTAQQWLIDEARSSLLEMGFKVFSPMHEVGKGLPHEVAPADLFALEKSSLVFALLDGLDAGTLFEVGYARALDISVVGVAECMDKQPLTMLLGSGCAITNDFATAIYSACWQMMGDV